MLYIVPTPIGNLGDITLRSLDLLKTAEVVLCEDPRQFNKLLNLLEITHRPKLVPLTKHHTFNLYGVSQALSQALEKAEMKVLLVSDAGMPGLSDPGFEVVRLAQNLQLPYTVLPGANAILPAVVGSGLIGKEFIFLGFLPIKKGRQAVWKKIATAEYPVVLYESVHRMEKFLVEVQEFLTADRLICIVKDVSKMYEQYWMGPVSELPSYQFKGKGEYVIVIEKS
jgi:16S rRNA (cytidine1402-2'-O)-methyltransferase